MEGKGDSIVGHPFRRLPLLGGGFVYFYLVVSALK